MPQETRELLKTSIKVTSNNTINMSEEILETAPVESTEAVEASVEAPTETESA